MNKSPIDLLPITRPLEDTNPPDDLFFYENVVSKLIPDIIKLEATGIPIDLDKVKEVEKTVNEVLENVSITLENNPLVQEYLKEKFKHISNIKVLHQDFFELDGEFDLILEQTFFCALDPKLRQSYSIKMNELLAENGKLVGVLFNREFGNDTPPFGGDKTEYQTYFNDYFDFKVMENCYNSIPPRAKTELFINLKKIAK